MDTGLGHVIGMNHARYPADGMQLVAKVIQGLSGAVSEVWGLLGAILGPAAPIIDELLFANELSFFRKIRLIRLIRIKKTFRVNCYTIHKNMPVE